MTCIQRPRRGLSRPWFNGSGGHWVETTRSKVMDRADAEEGNEVGNRIVSCLFGLTFRLDVY